MRRVVLALVLAAGGGCGRLGFDSTADSVTDGGVGATCGTPTAAPDPVTISGTTFVYTDFVYSESPVAATVVTVLDSAGATLATTTSDASGDYAATFATGGVAPRVALRFQPAGYFTTTTYLDRPLDHDVVGAKLPMWTAGDGPVWSSGAMDTVYSTTTFGVNSARSTFSIATTDCAGNALADVAVTVEPAPEQLDYLGTDGRPALTATGTIAPYAYAVAFNALPGSTRISAQKSGYTFVDQIIDVPAGDFMALVQLRPVE